MPTVPTYDTPQVLPSGGPAPYRQPAPVDNQASARQMGNAGAALQDTGALLTQEEVYAQSMANQVRVDAALNTVRQQQLALTYDPENGYLNKKGAAALNPDPLGRPLTQQYGEQLQDTINNVATNLGNDAQRRVFGEQAAALATQFGGDVQRHMLQEFRTFGLETQEGTIKLAADAAKRNWDDPDQIAQQVESAKAAVWNAGRINGTPANLVSGNIQQTTSAIHAGVIQAALENNNPDYALTYINAKKGEMTADDLLKVNGIVKADARARTATSTAMDAMTDVQRSAQPSATSRILEAAGVTDNTKGGGGAAYVNKLVTKYAGDSAKVLGATAIDEDVVDVAIKDAGKDGDWTTKLSPADQAKLTAAVTAYNAPALAKIPSQQDVHDAIRKKLGDNPDPKLLQAALAEGTRMYTDFTNDRKAKGENAMLAAQQGLVKNNGNLAALPPDILQAVTQYAPDKYDNLIDFSKKLAKGENTTNMPAYLDAVAHPEELAKMSDATFNHFAITNFSQLDGKRIADLRQEYVSGKAEAGIGSINRPALNTALNSRLEAIGINPAPKDLGEKSRVGSIQKFVSDGIFAQQQQLGRKMTAQEVSDYVDQTMAKNVTFRNTFLGMSTGTSQQSLLGMKVGDIPSESQNSIRAAFAARGNTRPTDDQILRAYWTTKNAR
jgi:soluble lytic murein transglycosylase